MQTNPQRIGILGGTFNPVHNGHLRFARSMADTLHLQQVLLMPCTVPPHKAASGILPFAMRITILKAALQDTADYRLCISSLEAELTPPSYTWNLLTAFRKKHPQTEPVFALGGEDFTLLRTWYRGMELPKLTHLFVAPRSGREAEAFKSSVEAYWPGSVINQNGSLLEASPNGMSYRCYFFPLPHLQVSSSHLRSVWMAGGDISRFIPHSALQYLEAHRDEITKIWNEAPVGDPQ